MMNNSRTAVSGPSYGLIALLVLAFMCLWNASALMPVLRQGELFGPDDFLRLAQVRAWMDGQSWFDMTAYKMVPPAGGDVHWSRIVDLPVAAMISVFSVFADIRTAENLAAIVWPFLLMVGTILVWVRITETLVPDANRLFAVLFGLFSIPSLSQFAAGRIDHHNLQILLFALMVLGLVTRNKVWGHALTGMAIALSVAVGIDTLIILAVVLAIIGLEWAFGGDLSGRGMSITGLSLTVSTAILYLIFVPPSLYWVPVCDANGLFFLVAFSAIGLAYVLLGSIGSHFGYGSGRRQLFSRLLLGAFAASLIVACLYMLFPTCLAGPVAGLDSELVNRWLSQVEEARPLWSVLEQYPYHWLATVGYLLAINMAGLYLVLLPRYRTRIWISLFALMLSCSLAVILQIRLVRTGIFVTIPFCVLIAHLSWVRLTEKYRSEPLLKYGFQSAVLVMLLSITWYVAGAILLRAPQNEIAVSVEPNVVEAINLPKIARRETKRCQQYSDYEFARSLQSGIMVSDLSNSMSAMVHTQHTVLSGPYHRNSEAILAVLDFLETDAEKAFDVAKRYEINFAGFCLPHLINHASEYPEDSMSRKVLANQVPDWMKLVSSPLDRFRVYQLNVPR